MNRKPQPEASVIALRKSCRADGVGLSHYILMDKQALTESGPHPHAATASVMASRKSCRADGVGLSHYILMDKKRLGEGDE
ncbi:modified peptide precursor CbpA [Sedimenticola hydrogenitrophicus]|uniref:modified peptide precursor CbpA n=1 Tax=Sedimenticola hydrogenitrophicus TaxID=2967975 RepID=UPI0023AE7440|nr:modified peptide precursor CbpA [Sedimenticola hydrogenitrophicus]